MYVPQNSLDCAPVYCGRSMKKLTYLIHCKGNVRSSQSMILHGSYNASIPSGVFRPKLVALCSTKLLNTRQWSSNRLALTRTNPLDGIFCLLLLRNPSCDLFTSIPRKIMKITKVFQSELLFQIFE
jgi:hypothetical protein